VRIWIILGLSVLSLSSWAGWTAVESQGKVSVYFDEGTLDRRSLTQGKVWLLFDREEEDKLYKKRYRSSKEFIEFDCVTHRYQILRFNLYPDRMGQGGAVDISSAKGVWHLMDETDLRSGVFHRLCPS
jgi:hypothetical protein